MRKKITAFWALILSVMLSLSACSGGSESSNSSGGSSDGAAAQSGKKVELEFYYPVAVGGPIQQLIDQLASDFMAEHPDIVVNPIYAGSYQDTMTKVTTAVQGGNPPDMAVLLSTELYTLLEMKVLEELTNHFPQEYWNDFFEGFMGNTKSGDQIWSVPFQRSTIVLYYNKDKFREAGLDPEKPPTTWEELVEYGKQLTTGDQWGIEIPSTGYQYWMLQAMALQTGGNIMSGDGKKVFFTEPYVEEALQFYVDLGQKHQIMPKGILEWATVPSDFISGKTAMMYHTTGNLTRVKNEANFDFDVAFLPANKQYGTPTGGGNIYVFKDIPEENKQAALEFIKFLTRPERVAQWSIDTGYVGTTKSAYETDLLKKYVEEFPQAAVARDQLQYADSELSTYQNGMVTKFLNDNVQAALSGDITPKEALEKSQSDADRTLAPYQ